MSRPLNAAVGAVAALACQVAHATPDGLADSYCFFTQPANAGAEVWRLDDDFASRMATRLPGGFTHADARAVVDNALQNLSRNTRARVMARVLSSTANCEHGSGGCIIARADWEDWLCWLDGPAAHITSTNDVTFCQDHGAVGAFEAVLEHEVAHTYGAAHIDPGECAGSGSCAPSDACEGETMCNVTGCSGNWSGYAVGDGRGLRTRYQGSTQFTNRPWTTASILTPGLGVFLPANPPLRGFLSAFAPRIDCARGTSPTYQCAVVRAFQSGASMILRITTLNGWSGSGWDTASSVVTTTLATEMPPDILLSNDGTVAWVTRVFTASSTNNVQVRRIDLATLATTTTTLAYPARFPPRLAISSGNGTSQVLVLSARAGPPNRWRLDRVVYASGVLTAAKLDLGTFDDALESQNNQIASDFDFDCGGGTVNQCAVFAALNDISDVNPLGVNIIQKRRFTVTATGVSYVSPAWEADTSARAQSVIGASRAMSGWAAGRTYLSAGRALTSGSDVNNTRLVEYPDLTTQAPSATLSHKGDDGTCLAYVTPQGNVGIATPHGGYSIAYCASCNGGNGTLEGVRSKPAEDGSADCY